MYIRIHRSKELIKALSVPARIISIAVDGALTLEVEYTVMPEASPRGRAVRITAISRTLTRRSISDVLATGDVDVGELVDHITSTMPDAKAAQKAAEQFILARRERVLGVVDAAARVTLGRRLVYRRAGELRRRAEPVIAVRGRVSKDAEQISNDVDHREALLDDLIVRGIDRSSSIGRGLDHGAHRVIGGLVTKARGSAARVDTRDAASSTQPADDQAVATLAPVDPSKGVVLVDQLVLPPDRLVEDGKPVDHVILRLELLDDAGATIDAVTSGFDLARHVAVFKTPRAAPIVTAARTQTGTMLHIVPGDSVTKSFRIFRRIVPRTGRPDPGYSLSGEFSVGAASSGVHVPVPPVRSGAVIYRVIPVGLEARVSGEYANVVVKPQVPASSRHVVLTATPSPTGLSIDVSEVPPRVRSLEIMRRDLTLKERKATSLGGHVHVDSSLRSSGRISVVDRGLKPGHVYEHVCKLTYVDGRVETAGHALTDYDQVREGRAMTSISDLQVDRAAGEPDASFDVTTAVLDSDIDAVQRTLERQGATGIFADDIMRERDRLKELIAHRIVRTDLTSGEREDFGTLTVKRFVDSEHRVQAGVKPLVEGHRYRYEVEALLRTPESMFSELTKVRTDTTTKRQHLMRPAKHRHPITMARGTVVTPATLSTRHAADAFGHGRIGSVATVDVVLDGPAAIVVDATAAVFDSRTVIVTWRVQGDPTSLDHFEIVKESPAGRQAVGKCHVDFPHGSFQFLHVLSGPDDGPAAYAVVPVRADYSTGDEVVTDVMGTMDT